MFEEEVKHGSNSATYVNSKALMMMAKMGYASGSGLGKNRDGPINSLSIPYNNSRKGFGLDLPNIEHINISWDFSKEVINVKEDIVWLPGTDKELNLDLNWLIKGPTKLTVNDEVNFCDPKLLEKILKSKEVFDELDSLELCKARSRANPFETIRSAFFMNRAALKMANIDAITGFIFTEIDRNPYHHKTKGPYYFADVCAGPGGFSEYILWRKKWLFKGFGFTLKGDHDFKLTNSQCISAVTFNSLYGAHDDGDICCPDNIQHFAQQVLHDTDGAGVHFMMSDGGFSVEGNENLQEVLSKQLYVCQCLMALEIVRQHGHFVTKLFDLFTAFSVGLIYLMYNCFEKIAIIKPNTSRPANSERYLICYGLQRTQRTFKIKEYLINIVKDLWDLRQVQQNSYIDINEMVPISVIMNNNLFYNYIVESNNRIGRKQVIALHKLTAFCKNHFLSDPRQEELRIECLKHWRIPDKPKKPMPRLTANDLLNITLNNSDFLYVPLQQIDGIVELRDLLMNNKDWHYTFLKSCGKSNMCNFYAGVGASCVFRLQQGKWRKVNKLQLIRGTLLYGEMIQETCCIDKELSPNDNAICKPSLHVIDALRLGDTSLADLPFCERLDLIETYCQAINHESRNTMRIRVKYAYPLSTVNSIKTTLTLGTNMKYCMSLPNLNVCHIKEYFYPNSILFFKTKRDMTFQETFSSRIQLCLPGGDDVDTVQISLRQELFDVLTQYFDIETSN